MSGTTTELALSTAVDTDDDADYLTLSLANSLRTIDALFNNVTGHTHASSHQGGPIAASSLRGGMDLPDWFRSTGRTTPFPGTGIGMEMYWSGAVGVLQAYNRATAAYAETQLLGSKITLGINGANSLVVNTDGSVAIAGGVTTGGLTASALTVSGNATLSGTTAAQALSCTAFSAGTLNASGAVNAGSTIAATGGITSGAGIGATTTINSGGRITSGSDLLVTNGTIYLAASGDTSLQRAAAGEVLVSGKITATQHVIAGSSFAFASLGRAGNEIALNVHVYTPGSIYAALDISGASITNRSAGRYKESVTAVTDGDCLSRIRNPLVGPVSYTWAEDPTADHGDLQPATIVGFLAEDMLQVVPEVVTTNRETGEAEGIQYTNLTAILWGALRLIDQRVTVLEGAV